MSESANHWWHWLLVIVPGGLIGLGAWRTWHARRGAGTIEAPTHDVLASRVRQNIPRVSL